MLRFLFDLKSRRGSVKDFARRDLVYLIKNSGRRLNEQNKNKVDCRVSSFFFSVYLDRKGGGVGKGGGLGGGRVL